MQTFNFNASHIEMLKEFFHGFEKNAPQLDDTVTEVDSSLESVEAKSARQIKERKEKTAAYRVASAEYLKNLFISCCADDMPAELKKFIMIKLPKTSSKKDVMYASFQTQIFQYYLLYYSSGGWNSRSFEQAYITTDPADGNSIIVSTTPDFFRSDYTNSFYVHAIKEFHNNYDWERVNSLNVYKSSKKGPCHVFNKACYKITDFPNFISKQVSLFYTDFLSWIKKDKSVEDFIYFLEIPCHEFIFSLILMYFHEFSKSKINRADEETVGFQLFTSISTKFFYIDIPREKEKANFFVALDECCKMIQEKISQFSTNYLYGEKPLSENSAEDIVAFCAGGEKFKSWLVSRNILSFTKQYDLDVTKLNLADDIETILTHYAKFVRQFSVTEMPELYHANIRRLWKSILASPDLDAKLKNKLRSVDFYHSTIVKIIKYKENKDLFLYKDLAVLSVSACASNKEVLHYFQNIYDQARKSPDMPQHVFEELSEICLVMLANKLTGELFSFALLNCYIYSGLLYFQCNKVEKKDLLGEHNANFSLKFKKYFQHSVPSIQSQLNDILMIGKKIISRNYHFSTIYNDAFSYFNSEESDVLCLGKALYESIDDDFILYGKRAVFLFAMMAHYEEKLFSDISVDKRQVRIKILVLILCDPNVLPEIKNKIFEFLREIDRFALLDDVLDFCRLEKTEYEKYSYIEKHVPIIVFSSSKSDIFTQSDFENKVKILLQEKCYIEEFADALHEGLSAIYALVIHSTNYYIFLPRIIEPLLISFCIIYSHLVVMPNKIPIKVAWSWGLSIQKIKKIATVVTEYQDQLMAFHDAWEAINIKIFPSDNFLKISFIFSRREINLYHLVKICKTFSDLQDKKFKMESAVRIAYQQLSDFTKIQCDSGNKKEIEALCGILRPDHQLKDISEKQEKVANFFIANVERVLFLGEVLIVQVVKNCRKLSLFSDEISQASLNLSQIYSVYLPHGFACTPVVFVHSGYTHVTEVYESNSNIFRKNYNIDSSYLLLRAARYLNVDKFMDEAKELEKHIAQVGCEVLDGVLIYSRLFPEFFDIIFRLVQKSMRFLKESRAFLMPITIAFLSFEENFDSLKVLVRCTQNELIGLFYLGVIYEVLGDQIKTSALAAHTILTWLLNLPGYFERKENIHILGEKGIVGSGILEYKTQPLDPGVKKALVSKDEEIKQGIAEFNNQIPKTISQEEADKMFYRQQALCMWYHKNGADSIKQKELQPRNQ